MTSTDVGECFAQSYVEARSKFMSAADAAGLDVQSHPHPMLGRDGEVLAMDLARDGPRDAKAVLILSSGCHGVEGFCGSGVQVALLGDDAFRSAARDAGVAVLHVHALNPYGFSWWRRTTHENVDLNRNFHDFDEPLPRNPGYDELAHHLVPTTWPDDAADAALERFAEAYGRPALQEAISGGQYGDSEGLFYGGRNPTWSHVALRHVLQDHATRCERLGWIDIHTGLGPSGIGERIFACRDDADALRRARAWWGDAVTSIYDGSSTSAPLKGMMWMAAYEEAPQAEYTGIALEYGTLPLDDVLRALRADQWLEVHPDVDAARRAAMKRRVRDAFYIDTDEWKEQVVSQGKDAMRQAVRGLSS